MIRIAVADDHAIVREGFKQILSDCPDIHIAGEASTYADAGGNWMMQMHEIDSYEYYRIEFVQLTASGLSNIYGELALYPGANTYQTMEMEPWTQYDRPLSVEDAILESPSNSLLNAHGKNNRPLGFKRRGA